MHIRFAHIEDFDQLLSLLRQLNPEDSFATEIQSKVFREILASEHLELVVAEQAGSLTGSCYLNIIPNLSRGGKPYALIENVITDPNHRRRGIGRQLITFALAEAWRRDCYKVMLMSGRRDERVHRFYRDCGFDDKAKQAYIIRAPG